MWKSSLKQGLFDKITNISKFPVSDTCSIDPEITEMKRDQSSSIHNTISLTFTTPFCSTILLKMQYEKILLTIIVAFEKNFDTLCSFLKYNSQ